MKIPLLFSLFLLITLPSFGKECPEKVVKQKFEFFIASNIKSEKLSEPKIVSGVTLFFEKEPRITNKDIETFSSSFLESGTHQMNLTFTKSGAFKLEELMGKNIGRYMMIVVNNQVVSTPVIQSVIHGGMVTVSYPDAKEISDVMSKICL